MSSHLPTTRIRRTGLLRGAAACTILIGTALCAVGCGSGFNAASLQVTPGSGSAQLGALRINGVVVVTDPATREAEVVAAVANIGSGPNQLVSVTAGAMPATVRAARSVSPLAGLPGNDFTIAGDGVTIASGSSVSFGQPGRPSLEISDGSFVPGHFTPVEFSFANVGQTTVNALVMSNTGLFNSYNLSPAASPTPSVVASETVSAMASVSPKPTSTSSAGSSVGASASASASPMVGASASAAAYPGSSASPTPVAASVMASSSAGTSAAKASTKLVRAPHLHGASEPRP